MDTTQQLLCGNSVGEERWEACLQHGNCLPSVHTRTQYNHAHVKAGIQPYVKALHVHGQTHTVTLKALTTKVMMLMQDNA